MKTEERKKKEGSSNAVLSSTKSRYEPRSRSLYNKLKYKWTFDPLCVYLDFSSVIRIFSNFPRVSLSFLFLLFLIFHRNTPTMRKEENKIGRRMEIRKSRHCRLNCTLRRSPNWSAGKTGRRGMYIFSLIVSQLTLRGRLLRSNVERELHRSLGRWSRFWKLATILPFNDEFHRQQSSRFLPFPPRGRRKLQIARGSKESTRKTRNRLLSRRTRTCSETVFLYEIVHPVASRSR